MAGQTDFNRWDYVTMKPRQPWRTKQQGGILEDVSKGSHTFSALRMEVGMGSSPLEKTLLLCTHPAAASFPLTAQSQDPLSVPSVKDNLTVHTKEMLQMILCKGQWWEAWKALESPEGLSHLQEVVMPLAAKIATMEGRGPV